MNKYTKILLKSISTLIVAVFVILAFLLVGFKIFGYQIYTVLSGSMEPTYHVGSLVYVKEVEQKDLKKGDSITFKLTENTIATHRIIEIVKNKETKEFEYRTKGDANKTEDKKIVNYKDIIGKVEFSIPLLGYFSAYIQQPPGSIVIVILGILAIAFIFFVDAITDKKKKDKEK